VHDRDLTGGAAKAVERNLYPEPERLFEGNLFDLNIAAVLHVNLKVFDKDKAANAVVQIDFSLDGTRRDDASLFGCDLFLKATLDIQKYMNILKYLILLI
jgi:hypothetical protein